jgi:hypothetical protein
VKPTTDRSISHQSLSSANSTDVKTFTVPRGASHIHLQAFNNDAFVTLDGTDPSTVLAAKSGLMVYAGQMPWFVTVGLGSFVKHVSATANPSILTVSYYE